MTSLRSIPAAPGALPLLGHLVPLVREPLAFLNSLPALGDLVRIQAGPYTLVMICDAELTRQALMDDRTFDKGGPIYDRAREVLGDGLASCPHDEHRRLRRLAQPAFHPARITGYAQVMARCIKEVTDAWHLGEILDVFAASMTIASEVTAAALFSGSLPAAGLDQMLADINIVVEGIFKRMFLIPPLDRMPTRGNRAYLRARAGVRGICDQLIADRRRQDTDHGDLLGALITARDPESGDQGMINAEISDAIVTFFLAGIETTASLLTWALDLLGRHPEIEQRLHTEVDTVLGGTVATHADLHRLQLTKRIVTETLRLRPPGVLFSRAVTVETCLGGHVLPVGTNVAYSAYIIHHRPDLYDLPETFDPDRWDPARPQPPRHAFIPFAAGARKCIGDTFAMTEATLVLATIAGRWRLKYLPDQRELRPFLGVSLRPRGLRMQATPRAVPHSTTHLQRP